MSSSEAHSTLTTFLGLWIEVIAHLGDFILLLIYRPGYRHKKASVLRLDLVLEEEKPVSLFRPVDSEREKKERRLMAAVDKLNP